jgi:sporulation protein YqfC
MLRKSKKVMSRMTEFLEIPKEISSNQPKITIVGFDELVIENYKGILEYEDLYVKINTHIGTINISGINLNLKQMTDEDILVTGKMDSIEIERNTD